MYEKLLLNVKKPIPEHDTEIIAWAIVTDGNISLIKHKKKRFLGFILVPRIAFTNTNYELIRKVHEMMGGSISICRKKEKKWKDGWKVIVVGLEDIHYLLTKILPYLPIKIEQANLLDEYCLSRLKRGKHTHYSYQELAIYEEIKKLNKRGRKK